MASFGLKKNKDCLTSEFHSRCKNKAYLEPLSIDCSQKYHCRKKRLSTKLLNALASNYKESLRVLGLKSEVSFIP